MCTPLAARRAGFTLVETMAVVCIAAILMTLAVPQIGKNAETVRVDKASADLNSLWRAERRHKLERGVFAATIKELEIGGYVDSHYSTATNPFVYQVLVGNQSQLILEASRATGSRWFGKLSLNEQGDMSGQLQSKDGEVIQP